MAYMRIYEATFLLCLAISCQTSHIYYSRELSAYRNYNTTCTWRSTRPRVLTTVTNKPPSQRQLTTAEQSYIEITYFSVTTMKLPSLVLVASARSPIATAMPLNEVRYEHDCRRTLRCSNHTVFQTSTIVAANSSSLALVNATSQTMSLANQSLQLKIEDMDEEKCLSGEEGCVVENGSHHCRSDAEECRKCQLACIAWLFLAPLCMATVCAQQPGLGPCCWSK
jgi:hypothetical protein